jgi:hypothetical protein
MNELRVQLYLRVGAVTIAGGRAEFALQRMAHVMSGGSRWNNLDTTVPVDWTPLTRELRKQVAANPRDDIRQRLGQLLDWAEAHSLWRARNNVIHGSWHEAPSQSFSASRHMRDGTSATVIASPDDLESIARKLGVFTRRLYELLDELTPGQHPKAEWIWPDDL